MIMKNEMEEFNMLYENKKELLQLVLNNKSAERIPIGVADRKSVV